MSDFNRTILVGRLTKDPELRYTASGSAILNFRIASTKSWKDKGGSKKEQTLFIDCSLWGKFGEAMKEYLAKGQQVLVSGELQCREWTDKAGVKKDGWSINCDTMQMVGERKQREQQEEEQRDREEAAPATDDDSSLPF